MVCKGVNDEIDLDGLIPNILVYGAIEGYSVTSYDTPQHQTIKEGAESDGGIGHGPR